MPDAAIDLLDRSMAATQMMNETSSFELKNLNELFQKLNEDLKDKDAKTKKDAYKEFYTNIGKRISYLLLAKVNYSLENLSLSDTRKLQSLIKSTLKDLEIKSKNKYRQLTGEDLTAVISYKTGIPIGKLQSSEQERLLKIEEELQKRIIGQDLAIAEIA